MLSFFFPVKILFLFLLAVAVLVLQIVLSFKKQDGRIGLILPGIFLLYAVISTLMLLIGGQPFRFHTKLDDAVTVLAVLLLKCIPALLLLGIYFVCRLLKLWKKCLIFLLMLFILPVSVMYKDGGTVTYHAVLYRIEFLHRLDENSLRGYKTGTNIYIFPTNFMNR